MNSGRDELNRINVFPVPDGDTGTNFALTWRSISEALSRLGDAPLPEVSRTAAQAAVMGSRGNSGMMLSHFLVGFDEGIGARFRLRAHELAQAIRRGFERLHSSLEHPVEGTILTVCREAATGAEVAAAQHGDVVEVIRRALRHAEEALARTPELLADLKKAGVVDAGGKGFVRMIEGVMRLIEGRATQEAEEDRAALASLAPAAVFEVAEERDFRYCAEVLVRGARLPSSSDVRGLLHELGGSLQVLRTGDLLRVHIHVNEPEPLFSLAEEWGEVLARKAEDMREQHRMLAGELRAVAVVTDTGCDLPDEQVDRHGIGLVPLQVILDDRVYRDRIDLKPADFYRRLRQGAAPTTSQPTVAQFAEAFQHARAGAEAVVAVILSAALSGTYGNAEAARRSFAPGGIHLFDSRTASLAQGLLAIRAAELAEAGWSAAEIVAELGRIREQSGILFTVDTLDNLIRSGRVSRARGWLGNLLDFKPILAVDGSGRIAPVARVRGRERLLPKVMQLLDECIPQRAERLRMGVVHADVPEVAAAVRSALRERYRPLEVIVQTVTPVLATHVGPGAWAVCWQVEDGIPERPAEQSGPMGV